MWPGAREIEQVDWAALAGVVAGWRRPVGALVPGAGGDGGRTAGEAGAREGAAGLCGAGCAAGGGWGGGRLAGRVSRVMAEKSAFRRTAMLVRDAEGRVFGRG